MKILVPLDGSPTAESILPIVEAIVEALAKLTEVELILLRAVLVDYRPRPPVANWHRHNNQRRSTPKGTLNHGSAGKVAHLARFSFPCYSGCDALPREPCPLIPCRQNSRKRLKRSSPERSTRRCAIPTAAWSYAHGPSNGCAARVPQGWAPFRSRRLNAHTLEPHGGVMDA